MGGNTFQVYRSDEKRGYSPRIVRQSVSEINNRSQKNGFNVVVFPEREQTAQYFIIEYVLSKIVTGRLGNIEPLSNCAVGCKLRIGTKAINGSDDSAIVRFGGICEDVCDDPRICICVPNGRSEGLLKEYIPLRYAHLFQRVDTDKPLTSFVRYSRIKGAVSSDESSVQRLANVRSYLTHSVLCVASSLRVASKLTSGFKIDGFDLSACLLVGTVGEDGVRLISRGQIEGIPSMLVCSDLVTALEYVENNPNAIESILVDASSIEKAITGDTLYRLQEICSKITIVTDFAGGEGIGELEDFGFDTLKWNRERLLGLYSSHNGEIENWVTRWAINFMTSSMTVIPVEDPHLESAFKLSRRLSLPDESADPVLVETCVRLNRCMFSCLRTTIEMDDEEIADMKSGIHDAIIALKSDRKFVAKETIEGYEKWAEILYSFLSKKQNAKIVAFHKIVEEAQGRRIVLVVDDHAKFDIYEGAVVVRRSEFHLLEASLHDSLVVFVGWFGASKMRSLIFSPKLGRSMLLLYRRERMWLRSRIGAWCKELGHEAKEFGFIIPDETLCATIEREETAANLEQGETQEVEAMSHRRIRAPSERRKHVRGDATIRQLDELEVIEFGLRGCVDRMLGKRGSNGEQVSVLMYELSGGYRAYFKSNHRVVCATSIVTGNDGDLETRAAKDLVRGDCVVDIAMSKDVIRSCADRILKREGMSKQREIAGKWREALRAELAFADMPCIASRLRSLGCKRSPEAISHWLTDEEFIGPNSAQDLTAIANLTERTAGAYLAAHLADVANAIAVVRSAHTAAGGELSRRMRSRVSEVIRRSGLEDPFVSGESVVLEDSEVGMIRIHQVLDGATMTSIRQSHVNKIVSL